MHHVALDRARPDDRDLDDEVVVGPRLQSRQHRHLRAAFNLEGAERVGLADHRVGARVLGRDGGEVERDALVPGQEVEAALHAGEHAERQHVDLHEAKRVDVVLVPFDDLAIGHSGRLDRHQVVEPVTGQHEPARVLAEVARRPDQLAGEIECQAQAAVGEVEVQPLQVPVIDAFLRPAPDLAREHADQVLRQAESLADVAQRTFGAVADHGRAERGAVPAVSVEHPLHDGLPPLVLEVHVDVRRLAPLLGDEALEQEIVAAGVDRGDAEHEAHGRVGGRPSPLAEDVLRAGEAHDRVHRQEIRRVAQLLDQQ